MRKHIFDFHEELPESSATSPVELVQQSRFTTLYAGLLPIKFQG